MIIQRLISVHKIIFSASCAINNNMSISLQRHNSFQLYSTRYGRFAIGARIADMQGISQNVSGASMICLILCSCPSYYFLFLGHGQLRLRLRSNQIVGSIFIDLPLICYWFIRHGPFHCFLVRSSYLVGCFNYNFSICRIVINARKDFLDTYDNTVTWLTMPIRRHAERVHGYLAHIYARRITYFPGISQPNTTLVDSSVSSDDILDITSKLSFYEYCVIEINKVAIKGRRVFRNATSSKIDKYAVGGNITFIDDIQESTARNFHSRLRRHRRYRLLRSRRKIKKFNSSYYFRRFFCQRAIRSSRVTVTNVVARRSVSTSVNALRLLKHILHYLHSIVLREKVYLIMRSKYPFDMWLRKRGIESSVFDYRDTKYPLLVSQWEEYLRYKVRRSFIRNIAGFLSRNLPSLNLDNLNRRNLSHRRKRFIKPGGSFDKIHLFNAFGSVNTNIISASYSYANMFCSSYYSSGVLLRSLMLLFSETVNNRIVYGNSYLEVVYQTMDKIDMCIRTVSCLYSDNVKDYIELCSISKAHISQNFLFYYRPYVSDVLLRTILRIPSSVGSDVVSQLPAQHKRIIRTFSHSTSKLSRYKRYLIRSGVLSMPTFSFLDGLFSCYYSRSWNTSARISTLNKLRISARTHAIGVSFFQHSSTYIYVFYYFFYRYIFLRRSNHVNFAFSLFSRINLFSGNSALFYGNNITTTCHKSTSLLHSFLDRISALNVSSFGVHEHSNAVNTSNSYINIIPFFHGNSIVFLHSVTYHVKPLPITLCTARSAYTGPIVKVLFDHSVTNRRITWHSLVTRNMIHVHNYSHQLRSNFNRARLFAQSSTAPKLLSDHIYKHRFNKGFITFNKKARTYFAMSRRHYQHKWYTV